MNGVAVEGFAQGLGTGERGEERDLGLSGQRQRHQAGGRSNVTEQGEHAVLDELPGVGRAAFGVVAVVQSRGLDAPSVDPPARVQGVKMQLRPEEVLQAQLHGRAAERGRLPEHDAVVADPRALRLGGSTPGSQGRRTHEFAHGRKGLATLHAESPDMLI
ncbi:hypothetical protein FQZ97_769540 [compost metagenome]